MILSQKAKMATTNRMLQQTRRMFRFLHCKVSPFHSALSDLWIPHQVLVAISIFPWPDFYQIPSQFGQVTRLHQYVHCTSMSVFWQQCVRAPGNRTRATRVMGYPFSGKAPSEKYHTPGYFTLDARMKGEYSTTRPSKKVKCSSRSKWRKNPSKVAEKSAIQ